jgi:hypothetical protein
VQLGDAVTVSVQLPAIFVGPLGGVGVVGGVGLVGGVGVVDEFVELRSERIPFVSQPAKTINPITRACLKLIAIAPHQFQNNAPTNVCASGGADQSFSIRF